MPSNPFLIAYFVAWMLATAVAIGAAVRDAEIRGELADYVRFLLVPWKIAVFVPAAVFVTFAGQFAYDDTWDVVSGGGMSLLTYLTAPWALGVFYRCGKRLRPRWHELVALVAMLFSASWFYDGWLLFRDGDYSDMWFPNLMVSPALYLLAGALWNVELTADGKPTFAFLRQEWPEPPNAKQMRPMLVQLAIPPVIASAGILIFSVKWRF
jgi:hypothetical protein